MDDDDVKFFFGSDSGEDMINIDVKPTIINFTEDMIDVEIKPIIGNLADDTIDVKPILGDLTEDTSLNNVAQQHEQSLENPYKRLKMCFEPAFEAYSIDLFEQDFNMSRTHFGSLLYDVASQTDHKNHSESLFKVPLSTQLLFCIWTISKQEPFNAVMERFKLKKCLGECIFKYIIQVLSRLMPRYVKWQNKEQQELTADMFELKSRGIPCVIGVIDTCHISIKKPKNNAEIFLNQKNVYSIILQAVCDNNGRFTDVFIGKPGSLSDVQVLKTSDLFRKMNNREAPLINEKMHLIADSAYPLEINLLTPYISTEASSTSEIRFNTRLSKVKSVIDLSFCLLKEKFSRLKFLDIATPEFARFIISACCMLYNYSIVSGELDEIYGYYNPDAHSVTNKESIEQNEGDASDAIDKRNRIKDMM